MADKIYRPQFPTGKHVRRKSKPPTRRTAKPAQTVKPVEVTGPIETKTQALNRVSEAGRDRQAFDEMVKLMADADTIAREGAQYLVPKKLTDTYIARTQAIDPGSDDDLEGGDSDGV